MKTAKPKKVMIFGCGRVGAELAGELEAQGYQVTVLDPASSNLDNLPPSFKGEAIQVSEITENTLIRAGIKESQIFIAITDEDSHNLLAAQIAKILFNVPKVICFLNDPEHQQDYESLGLEIINPISLLVREITQRLSP